MPSGAFQDHPTVAALGELELAVARIQVAVEVGRLDVPVG